MNRQTLSANFISFLSGETGRRRSAITERTSLSSVGLDGFALAHLGEDINKLRWMHGAEVTAHEMFACTTVGDVVDLLARKLA